MNVVENEVWALVEKELAAANERFPAFASPHEGYAVMLEEYEEAEEEIRSCKARLDVMWQHIKDNKYAGQRAELVERYAIHAICELIQFAAMTRKFMAMENNP